MKIFENSLLTLEANCGWLVAGLAEKDFRANVDWNCSLIAR
jgi:hypothetical protein